MARPIPVVDLVFLLIDRSEAPANFGIALIFEPPPGARTERVLREILGASRAATPTAPFDVVPEVPPLGLPHWVPPAQGLKNLYSVFVIRCLFSFRRFQVPPVNLPIGGIS